VGVLDPVYSRPVRAGPDRGTSAGTGRTQAAEPRNLQVRLKKNNTKG